MRMLPESYIQLMKSGKIKHHFETGEDIAIAVINGEIFVFRGDERYMRVALLSMIGFLLPITYWLLPGPLRNLISQDNQMSFVFLTVIGISLLPLGAYLIWIGMFPIIVVGRDGMIWRHPNLGIKSHDLMVSWDEVKSVEWWPMRPFLFSRVFIELTLKSGEEVLLSIRHGNSAFPPKKRKEFIAVCMKAHFKHNKMQFSELTKKNILN